MNGIQRRFGRRDVATMAAAATVLPGAAALGLAGAPGRASAEPVLQRVPEPHSGATMAYVSGHGSVLVPPDMASIVIGIEVEHPTLGEAQAEATSRATAIIDAIEAAGVAEADIQTTNFNVRIVRERDRDEGRNQRGEIKGFQVSNVVEVTVRALDTLGRILDDAIAAGANEVRQITFSLSDPAEAAAQARTRAVEDARGKADTLAAAAGMMVSRLVTISESYAPLPAPVELQAAPAMEDASGGLSRAEVPIAIGTDEIVVEIEAAYELK